MAIKNKKISELPLVQTLDGLRTIGFDKDNRSVIVLPYPITQTA